MDLLLDTHTLLWFLTGNEQLTERAEKLIIAKGNRSFVSMATLWEISIKNGLGKLHIQGGYRSLMHDMKRNGFHLLPIAFSHTALQNELPLYHRDPFDRMLIAQAITESMNLIGKDRAFDTYFENETVKRLW